MSVYAMSDLHGRYDLYIKMLEKIEFSSDDTLYILGDILDRGPEPMKILLDIMKRSNVKVLAGNHCVMALECMKFLMREITEESVNSVTEEDMQNILHWQANGGDSTIKDFSKYDIETRKKAIDFILNFDLYEEIEVNGNTFVMVHAGLGDFSPERPMDDYDLYELVWERPDYNKKYFDDKYVITGHTPTMTINGNPKPSYIYRVNNHIAIDCGCSYKIGRLGAIRLDDFTEFYVK